MRVLFLDDDLKRRTAFWNANADRHDVLMADCADAAVIALMGQHFDYISLDHDLCVNDQNRRSGFDVPNGQVVAEWLVSNPDASPNARVVIHSYNEWGASQMAKILTNGGRPWIIVAFNPQDASIESERTNWMAQFSDYDASAHGSG